MIDLNKACYWHSIPFHFLEFEAMIHGDGNNTNATGFKRESAGANKTHCQHFFIVHKKNNHLRLKCYEVFKFFWPNKKSFFFFSLFFPLGTLQKSHWSNVFYYYNSACSKKKNHHKHLVWLKLQIFWLILNIYSYAKNNESSANYKYPVDPHKNCIVIMWGKNQHFWYHGMDWISAVSVPQVLV